MAKKIITFDYLNQNLTSVHIKNIINTSFNHIIQRFVLYGCIDTSYYHIFANDYKKTKRNLRKTLIIHYQHELNGKYVQGTMLKILAYSAKLITHNQSIKDIKIEKL